MKFIFFRFRRTEEMYSVMKGLMGQCLPEFLAVMWCLEALPRLEAASRQNFHCLGLGLGLGP